MQLIFFLSLIELALIANLLWVAGSKKRFLHYTAAKTAASCGFLALALVAGYARPAGLPGGFWLFFCALLFCAGGDVLLGMANLKDGAHGRFFKLGAVSFGLAHLVFCVQYCARVPFSFVDLLALAVGAGACWRLCATGRIRLKKQKPLGIVYGGMVTLMAEKAIAGFIALPAAATALLATGSVLFWLSDAVLVFMYFGAHHQHLRRQLRFVNLSLYYVGVLLLAVSCAF